MTRYSKRVICVAAVAGAAQAEKDSNMPILARLFGRVSAKSTTSSNSINLLDEKWVEFKKKFGKKYASAKEEEERKMIFAKNLERAAELNGKDSNYVPYGHLSPLADRKPSEVIREKMGLSADKILKKGMYQTAPLLLKEDQPKEVMTVPASYSWLDNGFTTPVKNQGQCGSCWAFATAGNIEGAALVELKELISLSEQQLVDCDKSDNGCDGGLPEQADKWLIAKDVGLEREQVYPYKGMVEKCHQDPKRERIFVGNFVKVSDMETEMAAALMKYGPLSIGINANMMQMYMGGIAEPDDDECNPMELNHGVVMVAFGEDPAVQHPKQLKSLLNSHMDLQAQNVLEFDLKNFKKDFNLKINEKGEMKKWWKIRNSWGPEWGEEGHYRIVRGKGACGLNQMVTTATDLHDHRRAALPAPKIEEVKNMENKVEFYQ